jgi:hypothetical protein
MGLVAVVVIIGSWTLLRSVQGGRGELPKPVQHMTALDLASMTDAQLARVDPLVMNLIVARGIPALEHLDINRYAKIVDDWATRIDAANKSAEPYSKGEPAYLVSREFWMAGGMAVMLAGPAFGIRYTRETLTPGKPEQQFVHGVIDGKRGTCATMPVLYMAIGHRLGWPIRAVVSRDHMWARWDDGVPPGRGGKRFNLEATNASSKGGEGSFASLTDDEYAAWLGTPREVIESGSDMSSLTPRQTLGVFLQGRAGYWIERGEPGKAEADLELALECFPENRDIRSFHWHVKAGVLDRGKLERRRNVRRPTVDVDRINREHQRAWERLVPLQANPSSTWPPVPVEQEGGLNLHLHPPG